MKKTINKTNTIPINTDYPFGDIKNDDGTFNGTPINRELLADYVQFFEKMFFESGLNANGLPDNATNGFQLWQALENISTNVKYRGGYDYTTVSQVNANSDSYSGSLSAFISLRKIIHINITGASIGNIYTSMGNADIGTEIFLTTASTNGTTVRFHINSTNLGGYPKILKAGVTANDTLFTMPISTLKTIHFVRSYGGWIMSELP